MTEAQKRLFEKLRHLMRKRAMAPGVALEAEIKAVAEQLARLEAVRRRATEPAIGAGFAEWVGRPPRCQAADRRSQVETAGGLTRCQGPDGAGSPPRAARAGRLTGNGKSPEFSPGFQ